MNRFLKTLLVFFSFGLVGLFFIPTYTHAAPYPLTATVAPSTITLTMTGVPANDQGQYTLYNSTTAVSPNVTNAESMTKKAVGGVVKWNLSDINVKNNTTYYFHVQKEPLALSAAVPVTGTTVVTVGTSTDTILSPLVFTNATGQGITIAGKIDTTKYPSVNDLTVDLYYSKTAFKDGEGIPSDKALANAHSSLGSDSVVGVANDGSYYFELKGLMPSTQYYFRQTISVKSSASVLSNTTDKFNSTSGYTPVGSIKEQDAFDAKSYHLLAPWPGLAVLMDPDLCMAQKKEGKLPEGAVCDVNGLLNFMFKIMIGLTAVLLVLRLMYDGYQYMVTDVPFLKASAKSGFFTSLTGLLLALSAYLLLNTINPKLVNNTISIDSVNVGVEPFTYIDDSTFTQLTGEKLKTKSEYIPIVANISAQQNIDKCLVEATIQAESGWRAGAIGCDEDNPSSDVPSHNAFIQSGITYDGTKFSPGTSQKNNACVFNPSKPGFGLDWRFSKGGGLTQVTLFPPGYKTAAWYSGVKEGGTYWNNKTVPYTGWQQLVKPEDNIKAGIVILKENSTSCKGNLEQIFRKYQTGSCLPPRSGDSSLVAKTIQKKSSIYADCKK
jgi:hypothetical protein